MDLLAEKRQETFQIRKELTCTDLQEVARAKEAIRKDERRRLVEKWQIRWHGEQTGRLVYRLIPELATWLNREHGEVAFILSKCSQAMAVLERTCGALRRETRRCVATAISLWIMQSTHSLSSHLLWRRESWMGVEGVTTERASRNRIGACTCGPASRADLTVRVVRGRIPFIPPLAGMHWIWMF